MDKAAKNMRVLDLYVRLCQGKAINKVEEANLFGVDERTIQRDIDDIRTFMEKYQVTNTYDSRRIVYDRNRKGFIMTGYDSSMLTNSEILAVTKILLGSRAFTKKEATDILDKLIQGCVPLKNIKLVSDLIANEKYHYIEPHHQSYIQDKLWDIGMAIKEHDLLEIQYHRVDIAEGLVHRTIEPAAILFSEYYFYLTGYIVKKNAGGIYEHHYNYPAVFRIDRIARYRTTGEKFHISYNNRFEEGEFRKRSQFMYAGELIKIRLCYTGNNPEAVMDRLPTARIISEEKGKWVMEAEVYGRGVIMWLLSQGDKVEVLSPSSLREEMKEEIMKMLEKY